MARSSYVYLVTAEDCSPVAAFTVKHEMLTWLHANRGSYILWRLADGGHRDPTIMDSEE